MSASDASAVRAAALLLSYVEEAPGRFVVHPGPGEDAEVRLLLGAGMVVPSGDGFALTVDGAAAVVRFADSAV